MKKVYEMPEILISFLQAQDIMQSSVNDEADLGDGDRDLGGWN